MEHAAPTAESSWAVTPEKVDAAVERLVREACPVKLYLFGSFVRGQTGSDSDLDVLVVTSDTVTNPRAESVRLRRALRGIHMPVDILVVPESVFDAHRHTPGLIYREIAETGRLVYERPR
jgi:predicted nucleotidyltransferase